MTSHPVPGYDVLVVGSCMDDHTLYLPREPLAGETLEATARVRGPGGKGANQAVAAARAGARVALCATVGDDREGRASRDALTAEGIGVDHVRIAAGAATGHATILVEPTGDNRIVIDRGANVRMTSDQVRESLSGARRPRVILTQLEVPETAVRTALAQARRVGAVSVLNPSPYAPVTVALLADVEWVVLNEVEAQQLALDLGIQGADVVDVAGQIAARCGRGAVITQGSDPTLVADKISGAVHRISGDAVDVVDTAGAGDAFAGVFAALLARGATPVDASGAASRFATASVGGRGTQSSYPSASAASTLLLPR